MEALLTISFLAFLVERVINVVKPLVDPLWRWSVSPYPYLALVLGWVVAGVYAADVVLAAGAVSDPTTAQSITGIIITGIIIGGGSNVVSEVIGWLKATRENKTP